MERLTKTIPVAKFRGVPVKFDVDFIFGLDDKTWRGLQDIFDRLSEYEDTGLTPEQITAMSDNLNWTKTQLENTVKKYGLYHDGMADAITDIMAMVQDGRLRMMPAPGDEIYEIDGAHGIVKHTVTDVHWVANTVAVDDAGQTWGDYYTDEEIGNAYPTRKAAEFVMDASAAMEG